MDYINQVTKMGDELGLDLGAIFGAKGGKV